LRRTPKATTSIGIDLGLKDFAATSAGTKIEARQIYRGAELALGAAQHANKKRRVKTIHARLGTDVGTSIKNSAPAWSNSMVRSSLAM
jgi:transposase